MDKIWDRKSFAVGGHWPLGRGWKNRMTMQNRQKSNAKKKKKEKKKQWEPGLMKIELSLIVQQNYESIQWNSAKSKSKCHWIYSNKPLEYSGTCL